MYSCFNTRKCVFCTRTVHVRVHVRVHVYVHVHVQYVNPCTVHVRCTCVRHYVTCLEKENKKNSKHSILKTHTLFPNLPLTLPCHSRGWWNYLRSDCGWKYCISQNCTFDEKILSIMQIIPRGFNTPNNRSSCRSLT